MILLLLKLLNIVIYKKINVKLVPIKRNIIVIFSSDNKYNILFYLKLYLAYFYLATRTKYLLFYV